MTFMSDVVYKTLSMTERWRSMGRQGDGVAYLASQCKEEFERDHIVGFTLREDSVRIQRLEDAFMRNIKSTLAMEVAVKALQTHKQKERETREKMSTALTTERPKSPVTIAEKFGFTEKQLDLVKRTVAKNATDDELELFFYRCKELQLNPLLPGQVYFMKFKNRKTGEWNPGTVIIGIDGFRSIASRTGKLNGIKRGVVRNAQGQCIGGWADVYRKDWDHPAHEEVPFSEYVDPYKDIWKDMPETMIKKVAEVAALRMAFPNELGGMYSPEEMDQASRTTKDVNSQVVPSVITTSVRKPSEAQLKRLFAINSSAGLTTDELRMILSSDYGHESTKDLTLDEYNELCGRLESKTITVAKKEFDPPLGVPRAVEEKLAHEEEWENDLETHEIENMQHLK